MGLLSYFNDMGKDPYISFLFIIVVVKLIFIVSAVIILILKKTDPQNKVIGKLSIVKDKTHSSFTFLVSALIIYLFNPRKSRESRLDNETKLILFLFGWINIFYLIKEYITSK
jgi:uncharacterized protein YhhL (DUF1145 family)